jgi:Cysteine-rich secretory protein family
MARQGSANRVRVLVVAGLCLAVVAPGVVSLKAAAAPGDPEWLQIVNRYRGSAGVGPVTENVEASAGAKKHAEYLVLNRASGHDEYPKYKGYSREGLRAGRTGNVASGYGRALPPQREIVEGLLAAPFHGLAILNPKYTSFGFASTGTSKWYAASMPVFWENYQEPTEEEIAADVEPDWDGAFARVMAKFPKLRGGSWEAGGTAEKIIITVNGRRFLVTADDVRELGKEEIAALTGPTESAVADDSIYVWPGEGTSVPLVRYSGNESPDPIAGCPGFSDKAGLPLLIFGAPIELSDVSFREAGGEPQVVCVLTAETFQSKDQGSTEFVRGLLRESAIIIPKNPLTPGRTYEASAKVANGPQLKWSFSVATTSAIGLPSSHPLAGEPTPGVASQLQAPTANRQTAKKTTKKKAAPKTKK